MRKNFELMTITELEFLYNTILDGFDRALNDSATQELFNDDGEYNYIEWLQNKLER